MSLKIRRADERDLRLVVGNWVDSYRKAHAAGLIAMEDWDAVMEPQVRKLLARPNVDVLVAYHPDETDRRHDLYGWIAVEHDYLVVVREREFGSRGQWVDKTVAGWCPLLHYCYVKSTYRRRGVARALFKAAHVDPLGEFIYTCKTGVVARLTAATHDDAGRFVSPPKLPRARWNPLIARFPKAPIVEAPNPEPKAHERSDQS